MQRKSVIRSLAIIGALGAVALGGIAARGGETIERVDFNMVKTATVPAYQALLAPACIPS